MKKQMDSYRLSGAGLFFAAAAFLAILSFFGIYSFLRASAPTSQVWAARSDLLPGHLLDRSDLVSVQVPESAIPAQAILDPAKAVGMRVRYGMVAGDVIRTPHLVQNANSETPRKIGAMGTEYRAMMLSRESVPDANKLIPGDRIEILGIVDYKEGKESTPMLMPLGLGIVLDEQAKKADSPGVLVAVTAEEAARISLVQQSGSVLALLQGDKPAGATIEAMRLDYLTTQSGVKAPKPAVLTTATPKPANEPPAAKP